MNYTMPGELSSHGKAAEGSNATQEQEMKMKGTIDLPADVKPFPFLKLPAEIRNAIYQLALLTQNVTTDTISAELTCRTVGEATNNTTIVQTDDEEVGTIRCESWRTYTIGYQVSILRVSRKIHHEAWGIFQLDNFWTIVRVNKEGFGQEMKDHGFPVMTGGDAWRHIKYPVMKVMVTFPSLEGQKQSDFLFLATVHLNELMRALWTAKGASQMEILIHLQRPLTNNSPSQGDLLQPFFKLRNIKKNAAWSVPEQRYIDLLSRAITTTEDINLTYGELQGSIKCLRQCLRAGQWGQAFSYAKEHSILMNDCKIVYGNCFIGTEPDLNTNTAIFRGKKAQKIIVATAVNMADVSFRQRLYANSVRFAEHALSISNISNYPNLNPPNLAIIPSYHQCLIFLTRARAYMGMKQAEAALRDIKRAREFIPDDKTLAFMFKVWQEKFGPLPGSDLPV